VEVRAGYKQTEVGVIPHEWDAGGLGRFWSVTDCKHVTAEFVSSGFPIASIKEVQSRFVDLTTAKQTTRGFYNLLTEGGRKPQPGDLIVSRNATVGEIAQVMESHPPFAMGQDVCLFRKKFPYHSTEYLQAIFQSPIVLNQLSNLMVGSTFKRVNVEQIRNFAVPMPSPREQRAIAAALSDVDALLEGLTRLIAKKRDLKQAAMQQLITGQTRLPGFHREWKINRLGQVAEVKTGPFGSSLHESDYVEVGTPIITVEHLGEFGVEHANLPLVSKADRRRLSAYSLVEGDIVFSRVGSVDRNALVRSSESGWLFSGRLLRVRPEKQRVYAPFLSYQFHSETFKASVRSVAVGQTMASLNTQILNGLVVTLPSLPEQTAIAAVLSDMDAELAALEARREKTRALKQAMMQELLTGRTRLV
jgi:type I restriction enzyme, S subunit